MLAGWFDYRSEQGSAEAVPGSVLFGNAGAAYRCWHKDTLGNKRLVAWFDETILVEIADSHGLRDAQFHRSSLPPGKDASEMFVRMRRLATGRHDADEAAYALATAALRMAANDVPFAPPAVANKSRILAAVRHIEEFYAQPCALAELARLSGYSRYHFLRLFKSVTGQSPNQYLVGTRLRAAADQLLTTLAPVSAIALDVGFNDISHFNASFRAMFHCSPTAWRGD